MAPLRGLEGLLVKFLKKHKAYLERADIPIEGLFLNADAGFDSKDFRKTCGKKEVNANICFNKRNGDVDRDEYFDKEL